MANYYPGLPLAREVLIEQLQAAEDALRVQGAASQTADFLSLENATGTEKFVINADGDISVITNFADDVNLEAGEHVVLNKTDQTTFSRLRLPVLSTAPSSASLSKGDLWLTKATTDVYRLAMCISTATGAVRYGTRVAMSTLGASDPINIQAGDTLNVASKGTVGQTSYARLRLPILSTAPASGNMSKGDLYLAKATTDVYRIAMCISSATGASRYGNRFGMSTLGGADSLNVQAGETVDASAKGTVGQTAFARLRLPILSTAPASASLAKGDLWLSKSTTDVYRLTLCISAATGAVRYGGNFIRQTIGTASS